MENNAEKGILLQKIIHVYLILDGIIILIPWFVKAHGMKLKNLYLFKPIKYMEINGQKSQK